MAKHVAGPGGLGPKEGPKVTGVLTVILGVSLFLILISTGMFFSRMRLPGETAKDLPITDQYSDIEGLTSQERRQFQSTTDRVRCEMIEVRQQVELIWENIAALEAEIATFKVVFMDVAKSKLYPELLNNDFAVRYFAKDIKDPLPHVKTPIHCAERLNVLMYTVNRALATNRAAFDIEYPTRQKIEGIEEEVNKALDAYRLHREFIEALRALTARGALSEAETMLEAAHEHRLQRALDRMGSPDALREEYRSKPQPSGRKRNKRTSSIGEEVGKAMTLPGD